MRFTKLSDHEVRPGRLTEWHPVPRGGWAPDPRPASYLQETGDYRLIAGEVTAGSDR